MGALVFIVSSKVGLLIDYILGMFISGIIVTETISNKEPKFKRDRLLRVIFWPYYLFRWFFRAVMS